MTDLMIPKHSVIQYVRTKKRVPHGVIIALKIGSGFICGYSLCNKKDRFNKKMALKIAIGRADTRSVIIEEAPHEVRKMLPSFVERCKKYYKVQS
jgi:hypothetical protein